METIDRELHNLSSMRRHLLGYNISATTRAEIIDRVDDLLDQRNRLPQ